MYSVLNHQSTAVQHLMNSHNNPERKALFFLTHALVQFEFCCNSNSVFKIQFLFYIDYSWFVILYWFQVCSKNDSVINIQITILFQILLPYKLLQDT